LLLLVPLHTAYIAGSKNNIPLISLSLFPGRSLRRPLPLLNLPTTHIEHNIPLPQRMKKPANCGLEQ
ncbi:hypothetical protein ACOQJ6_32985, partial [Klebsiella pneumoniae]|uniref:hypothetical protein n=1 Tax=Klebsiella pneumoniae TaxID=573 RepID=UPI0030167467